MKEKHSGINKKVKNGTRALLALLVAAAFILPAGGILADEKSEPREEFTEDIDWALVPESPPMKQPDRIDPIQQPLALDEMPVEIIDLDSGDSLGEFKPSVDDPIEDPTSRLGDIIFEQPCVSSSYPGWSMPFSDAEQGYRAYDNYVVDQSIGAVGWYGLDVFSDDNPAGNVMSVEFFADDGGLPDFGNPVGGFTGTCGNEITFVDAGDVFVGYTLYYYEFEFPSSITMDSGWVSVYQESGADVFAWGMCPIGDGMDDFSYQENSGPNFHDLAFTMYSGGPGGGEYEWNAVVKYIYIEDEIWDPEDGEYKIIPKIIHTPHDQACKNEYLHDDVESFINAYAPNPDARCNKFPPGELYIGAEIGNHGNNTYINLPVHLNVWKQIYDEILVSDFEDHVFSDWEVIDGGGCVHPYPDGDTWNMTTARYHSAGTSMHVSKTASYMKGANDTLRNRYPLNTHGGDCAEISFWFWVEGDYDSYPWKAYDYLQMYWIQRPHSGPEIRHGPLDVMVTEPGPTWYWSSQADWGLWGGDHGQPMCWNSGGPGPNWYSDPVWSKGVIEIPDEWKCDQTFIEFVWKADCMNQYEGAYIDDVVISRVINQGEKVYSAHEQVTLVPGEQKFMRFSPPWGECCPPEHGKYWIEVRVKTHSNFVADENPADDWIKDEIIVKCHHDVGVTDVDVWPFTQYAGDVFSYLVPTNVSFTVKNFCAYDDEFDVKMTVHNMEYDTSFVDDVESGNRGWEHGAFDGPDLWHITTRDANSPTHSWAAMESDVGFYDNGMWNYLLSPTLNFEGLKDAYTCFNAKWALGEGDEWWWFIYDPYSNFIIRFGPSWSGDSGDWLPGYDGHPIWVGQKNPAQPGIYVGGDGGVRFHQWCMPIKAIIEYLNDIGFGWLGVEMFGPQGDPEYRAGFGFALITDGAGRESTTNVEKWSGLFIDDVTVFTVEAGETVYEETWTVLLPAQGGEQTIYTKYCWPGIWGDFEVDVETLLETDCNPDNNWMDGYNHIYYSYWFDDMEEYTYYDANPFEGEWTHEDLTAEDGHWHVVQNMDPVEGYQDYWWCGIEDDTFYGPNWNDCLTSPIFDLYSLIPRSPWQMAAVQIAFRMCYHLDIGDAFFIDISNDSGRNWHTLEEWYGPEQSDCWHDYEILIPQNYYTETFMFRFRFYSDGVWENKGVLLDDIFLEALKGKNVTFTDEIAVFEDFGTIPPFPPDGWSQVIYSGTGEWEAVEAGVDTYRDPLNAAGLYATADSDGNPTDIYDVGLFTPEIDCTGITTVSLDVDCNFQDFAGDGDLVISTFSGGAFEEILGSWTTDQGPFHFADVFDATGYADPSTVQIEFRYDTDGDDYAWHASIDNVIVTDGAATTLLDEDFGTLTTTWPPTGWTLFDYDANGVTWEQQFQNSKMPDDGEGFFAIADSDGNSGFTFDDGLLSAPIDVASAVPDGSIFTGAKLDFDFEYEEFGANPDNEWGEVRLYVGGVYTDLLAMYNTDSAGGHETFDLPYADDIQIEFYYNTGGDTWEWFFSVDNFQVTVSYETIIGMGDPLAWFFEDDAETGGNPLWTNEVCPGGDLWRAFCYPVVTEPVYSTFGELISPPVMEECPDDGFLQDDEPWLFPPPSGDHFWMAEKHHWEPYDDGINIWPKCSYSYLNNMDNVLITPEIDLTGAYHAHLIFYMNGWLGVGDEFWVMVREKNDDGSWGPWNWMENFVPFFDWEQLIDVESYYGLALEDSAHPYFLIDLKGYIPPFADEPATIQVGFRLISDEAGVGGGIKIDDVLVAVKQDTVAPATTCDISGTMGCNDWYTSGVTVRLSTSDNLVGVKETYYRIDGGAWQLYDDRFQVTVDGAHTVEYYSVDRVGNVEEIQTCESFKIDQTAPTVGLSMPETGYLYVMGRPIFQIGRTIVIGDLSSQASASDATSGIDYVEFIVDGEVKSADLSAPFTFDLPKGGLIPASHTLQVKAYDNACNAATSTQLTYLKWF